MGTKDQEHQNTVKENGETQGKVFAVIWSVCGVVFIVGLVLLLLAARTDRRLWDGGKSAPVVQTGTQPALWSGTSGDEAMKAKLLTDEERKDISDKISSYDRQIVVMEGLLDSRRQKEENSSAVITAVNKNLQPEQTEALICDYYIQNIALVLEIKEDILAGIGYEAQIPDRKDSAVGQYYESVEDDVISALAEQVAGGVTAELLASSVGGALDSVRENPSFEGFFAGAFQGLTDGVTCIIQEAPMRLASEFFGGKLVSCVSAAIDIAKMDGRPEYLIGELGGNAKTCAAQLKKFLIDESVTADECYQVLYWYKEYVKTVRLINEYSGETVIPDNLMWFYDVDISMLCEQITRNENEIRMLGGELQPVAQEAVRSGNE